LSWAVRDMRNALVWTMDDFRPLAMHHALKQMSSNCSTSCSPRNTPALPMTKPAMLRFSAPVKPE